MNNNPFSLSGKTILITGASSGIGKSAAIEISKLGGKVILTGRDGLKLSEVLSQLEGEENNIISGDLKNPEFLQTLVDSLPKVDGLVNCAGVMKLTPLRALNDSIIDELVSLNYLIPIKLIRNIIKERKLMKYGSIVNITSINGGGVGTKAHSLYASTKAGLTGFSRSLAIDLGKHRIRVNCVAPGMVNTEGAEAIYDVSTSDAISADIEKYPMRRYGEPEEIAHGVIYLLSDASKWVTGITLTIDGGFTAQ